MRKTLRALLLGAAVVGLAACSGSEKQASTETRPAAPQETAGTAGSPSVGNGSESFAGYGGTSATGGETGQGTSPVAGGENVTGMAYAVGDTGPAGGVVYFVSAEPFPCGENLANLCNYLESARADSEVQRGWSDPDRYEENVDGADATAIGTGAKNTAEMVLQGNADPATSAAAYTAAYELNGFDDWYLPSKDEFLELYRQRDVVGGFSDADYWSSSEIGANMAWSHRFNEGHRLLPHPKYHYTHLIRPVRAF